MSDQSGSLHLRVLFEGALENYKQQTGIKLVEHPLAERLQYCNSVEPVTAILREDAQDLREFREKDKVLNPLKKVLTVLRRLSPVANFALDVGLHLSPVKAIQTGLGILLFAVKGAIDDYDALADLLESIGHFLNRLEIYTEIPPTEAMNEMVVNIFVELLSTLASTTKDTKQGKLKKLVRKLVGEKKMEAIVQRLDRLTQDEARQTVVQILKVVHSLVENMKVIMDDGEVSVDHLMETLEIMHQVAGDLNKPKRDSLQKDIFGWLSPPNPWKNHHVACKLRHRGTAEWFIQGNTFSEWRTSEVPGSLLWVHGKPGAGKTIFCSTIIEDIYTMQKAGLVSLAFFYCDFREDRKKELRGLLSSFLVQLYHQSDSYFNILFNFYSEHDKGSRLPSDDALVGCLMDLLNLPGLAPVYLIVDALHGCPNPPIVRSPRAKVLSFIEELVTTQIQNLRVCVTSRPEFDIKDVLNPLIFRSVSLHDESGQNRDIEDYIRAVINTLTIKRWKEEHRQLVIDALAERSNGMFRWVYCQVDHIHDCIPARLPQALAELPKTLDETYDRTLRGINEANWEFAHRMFQFASVASRPLHDKELADLLAFDFEAGSIPKFYEDWRLEDPADAVLSTCSALLAVVNDQGSPVIQFSHFSVKDFLTSTRLAKATDVISRRYHVSMTPAHTLVAQACLGILLHLDKGITSDSLDDFPLAEYAAEHWVYHSRFEGVSRNVEDGMKQLFDPRKPHHLAICVWLCDPAVSTWKRVSRNKTPLPLPRTSLHYAAFWGLHPVVEFLIIERDVDLNAEDDSRETPLHVSSQWGRSDITRLLLDHGAEADHLDSGGWTPLHIASYEGYDKIVNLLFDHGGDANRPDNGGWTPLLLASWGGHEHIVRLLLDHGVNANHPDNGGWTPLHAASREGHEHIIRLLLDHSVNANHPDNGGWTPLHAASQEGHDDSVKLLLDHGVDPNRANYHGSTSLHVALQRNHHYIVQLLLNRGAYPNYPNSDGSTPLHLASQRDHDNTVRLLLHHGAVANRLNSDGWASLHLASQRGHYDVVGLLLDHGAETNHAHINGSTPLHLASQEGHDHIVRLLLDRGGDANSVNRDGWTPLNLASQRGHDRIVRLLLEHGADADRADHPNSDSLTPMGFASREGGVKRKPPKDFAIATRTRRRV